MDLYRVLPKYWKQGFRTCKKWDNSLATLLNHLIDQVNDGSGSNSLVVNLVDSECIVIHDYVIDISSFPDRYGINVATGLMPKVETRKKLRDLVISLDGIIKLENKNPSLRMRKSANWLKVLGIWGKVDKSSINSAANKLLKRHHPDVGGNLKISQSINQARTQGIEAIDRVMHSR